MCCSEYSHDEAMRVAFAFAFDSPTICHTFSISFKSEDYHKYHMSISKATLPWILNRAFTAVLYMILPILAPLIRLLDSSALQLALNRCSVLNIPQCWQTNHHCPCE